jgi:hypothetical protein
MKVCLLFVLEDAEEAAFRASVGGSGWRAFRVAVQKSWRDGVLEIHAQPRLKPLGLVGCRFGTLEILYVLHGDGHRDFIPCSQLGYCQSLLNSGD